MHSYYYLNLVDDKTNYFDNYMIYTSPISNPPKKYIQNVFKLLYLTCKLVIKKVGQEKVVILGAA